MRDFLFLFDFRIEPRKLKGSPQHFSRALNARRFFDRLFCIYFGWEIWGLGVSELSGISGSWGLEF